MGGRTMSGLLSGVAAVLLVVLQSTQSVYIQYQGFQVHLESVKNMSNLERQWVFSPRLQAQSPLPIPCYHLALPADLQPICTSKEAASIFQALKNIAGDDCELCVNVACTGCFSDGPGHHEPTTDTSAAQTTAITAPSPSKPWRCPGHLSHCRPPRAKLVGPGTKQLDPQLEEPLIP
ncbi:guanylate cyclase activator 2B [Desmodus rotundus]|uniref:guanylate cyclase activator 2B n=1 Tax=Desmodus rotundus TaxID=9430 RepID=UPI000D181181|nr:guanylate cyclase activator 2B [Desmodus rotundus]